MRARSIGIILLVFAVLVGVGLLYRNRGAGDAPVVSGSSTPAPNVSGSKAPAVEVRARLFLDGWSLATIGSSNITYTGGSASEGLDPATGTLAWKAVTGKALKALAKSEPRILAGVVARLVSGSSSVSCDQNECRAGRRTIKITDLEDLTKVTGLGTVYSAYKVRAAIWEADVSVPKSSQSVSLSLGDTGDLDVSLDATIGDVPAEVGGGTTAIEAKPSNGFGKNMYPISSAFGQLFFTDPGWIGDEARGMYGVTPDGNIPVDGATWAEKGALGARGLRASEPGLDLENDQMTYLSSPTTGCGRGVLCAPVDTGKVVWDKVLTQKVCSGSASAILLVRHGKWSFTAVSSTIGFGTKTDQDQPSVVESAWKSSGKQTGELTQAALLDGTNASLVSLTGVVASGGDKAPSAQSYIENPGQMFEGYQGC